MWEGNYFASVLRNSARMLEEIEDRRREQKIVEKVAVQEHVYEMARGLLMDGASVDVLERTMKIPHEELLRMKADVEGEHV